ncbi:MAG TPA: type VI secretion system tip protein TssI/VgrG [Polyangiaceae bacterium]|nr:type VI secretion system tip protein TssI/VgrG [Polyangiaceae bacterium]
MTANAHRPELAYRHSLELLTARDLESDTPSRFDVRSFVVSEAMSTLFRVRIKARHVSPSLDFDAIVGKPAHFFIAEQGINSFDTSRVWSGIINELELVRSLPDGEGLCSYELSLVPTLWLLTQRRNYRIFQYESEVDIALALLDEWKVPYELRLDPKAYKKRKYKVQYAETDYEFLYRVLSDVGVTFFFERHEGDIRLVVGDAPERLAPLAEPLAYHDEPANDAGSRFATNLRKVQRVRPNRVTLRDRDYRRDSAFDLSASAKVQDANELELFYYPENFNFVSDEDDGASPAADDRGRARTDPSDGERLATIDLEARRNDHRTIELDSNDLRLSPGVTFGIEGHPADDINQTKFLVVESHIAGRFDTLIQSHVEAVTTQKAYRASLAPKPRIIGVESATVVGPKGDEIHCDEFGRVRVHFHWDRRSDRTEQTSCWIPVSQTWGGSGFGGLQIPRIGQEVLVEFLNGDPDRPIVTGRVFTAINTVPTKLPVNKTQTVLKSNSTGGGGGYNEIMMEDCEGRELLRMRAQLDKDELVNRNCVKNVGSNQSLSVGENRSVRVRGNESKTVVKNRVVQVTGAQVTKVKEQIEVSSLTSTVSVMAAADAFFTSGAKMFIAGLERIVLGVQDSLIIMTPSDIVIQAAKVSINPGAAFAQHVMDTGSMPEEPVPPARRVPLPGKPLHDINDPKSRAWAEREYSDAIDRYNENQQQWAEYSVKKDAHDQLVADLRRRSANP